MIESRWSPLIGQDCPGPRPLLAPRRRLVRDQHERLEHADVLLPLGSQVDEITEILLNVNLNLQDPGNRFASKSRYLFKLCFICEFSAPSLPSVRGLRPSTGRSASTGCWCRGSASASPRVSPSAATWPPCSGHSAACHGTLEAFFCTAF